MRIEVNTVAEISKGFGVKRVKRGDAQVTLATLKFAGMFLDREYSDEILGLPIQATALLYGEDGIPVSCLTVGRKHITFQFAGSITGNPNKSEQILLAKDTEISKLELQLVPNGAKLNGQFVWAIRGDEAEDLEPLLGNICLISGIIVLPEQVDAFSQAKGEVDRLLGKMGAKQ
jgi:hypothetical protein